MPESFQVRIEPTICTYCPEKHAAVAAQFGSTYVVMPTAEAERLAGDLFEASALAEQKFAETTKVS